MLQAEYDYDLDMQVKAEEAKEEKAIEDSKRFLADGKYTAEKISSLLGIPVESFATTVNV